MEGPEETDGLQPDTSVKPDTSAQKVLIYRLGSLGDTVVALPCFHLIARAFPNAERRLLTNFPVHAKAPASAAVLGDSSLVHGYMRYTVGTRNIGELLLLARQIRRFHPDLLVYLTVPRGVRTVKRDAAFFRLCGIRRIVGLPIGGLAENGYNPASGLWEREAARLLRCVHPLGDADVDDLRNWDLRLTDAETGKAKALLAPLGSRPIVACGPGTKQQSKDWGQEKWSELLTRLSAELPEYALALIGAREESSLGDYAAAGWKGPVLNLCGELTPRESAAVIRHARLFLGPDSGPMHLAAANGVPCAIPFSSIDHPGRAFPIGEIHRPIYHPVACSHCMLSVCVEKKKICINSITVEEMLQAALQAIRPKEVVE
jgi:ADP-heptose:LPS heptosyltransferase